MYIWMISYLQFYARKGKSTPQPWTILYKILHSAAEIQFLGLADQSTFSVLKQKKDPGLSSTKAKYTLITMLRTMFLPVLGHWYQKEW